MKKENRMMRKNLIPQFLIVLFLLLSCKSNVNNSTNEKQQEIERQVNELLSQMTLEEKIGQMSQIDPGLAGSDEDLEQAIREGRYGSFLNLLGAERVNELQKIAVEESRLGIPIIFARDVIHGFKTIFPIPLGMAASWNPEIVKKAFRISAIEASSVGIKWTFAPMIDITWDPRWGRIAEGCGEDPYLTSVLSKAMVEGIQGDDLTNPTSVAACAKHYIGYGFSEAGRDYNTTYISEPVLRNVALKPFKAAQEAGALTFMSAFNDLNGVPTSGNEFTLRQILRDEWNYDGMVVSDWASIEEMISHGYCADKKEAALKAIQAGVDMEMASDTYFSHISELVEQEEVDIKLIDEAVRNILRVKIKLGLFENPYIDLEASKKILNKDFLAHAQKVARESIVLLKNEKNTLPLSEDIKSVAVIGPLADAPRDQLGTWVFDGEAQHSVTPVTAIKKLLGDKKVNYAQTLKFSRDEDKSQFAKAKRAANNSDAIVFFAGEEWILSGEGQCRGEIDLPGAQTELIEELKNTGKPLILVFMAGRPLAIGKELEIADAVLYAWHGGTMAGPAIADILFGKYAPSGKLPVTFVKGAGQIPFYYYRKNTGRPSGNSNWTHIDDISVENPQNSLGYKSHHLDYGFTPLLPFGYGLTYTTFEYTDLKLSANEMTADGSLEVSATIANTGQREATEIAQLYIRDRIGSITRPIKELKSYSRVTIKPGEKAQVRFKLTKDDLEFFNGEKVVVEPGEFDVWIGTDSDSGLHGNFSVITE